MIRPGSSNKIQINCSEKTQKSTPELLATILAFISVFVFFFKILFF